MISAVNHITLAVKEIERSFIFYRELLGFKPLVKWHAGAYFLIGEEDKATWFCLNRDEKRIPNPCYTHHAFSVSESAFQPMVQKLIAADVSVFKTNTSPLDSFYFLDPDGHKLELHVGDWQQRIAIKKQSPGNWRNSEWFEV